MESVSVLSVGTRAILLSECKMKEFKMVTLSLGNKKRTYKSIKLAAEASGIKYITAYMRLRAGMPVAKALKSPVRKYVKA